MSYHSDTCQHKHSGCQIQQSDIQQVQIQQSDIQQVQIQQDPSGEQPYLGVFLYGCELQVWGLDLMFYPSIQVSLHRYAVPLVEEVK